MATYSSVHNGRGRSQRRGETRRSGQWKLAYADFLTALMAFFLLMWLSTDSSAAERAAIAAYFSGNEQQAASVLTTTPAQSLQLHLSEQIDLHPVLAGLKTHIQFTSEPEHIRIELSDAENTSLFTFGASELNDRGTQLVYNLGELLAPLPFALTIEGHTDAFKTASSAPTNWDISSARANHALETLQAAGIAPTRFKSVTGFAATRPLLINQPHAGVNRRISIVLELSD